MTAIAGRKSRKQFHQGPPPPDPAPTEFLAAHYHHRTAAGWKGDLPPHDGRVVRRPPPQPIGGEGTDTPIVRRHDQLARWRTEFSPTRFPGRIRRGPTPLLQAVAGPYCIDVAEVWAVGAAVETNVAAAEIYIAGPAAAQLACE